MCYVVKCIWHVIRAIVHVHVPLQTDLYLFKWLVLIFFVISKKKVYSESIIFQIARKVCKIENGKNLIYFLTVVICITRIGFNEYVSKFQANYFAYTLYDFSF